MRMRLILSVALPVCILLLGTGVLLYTRSVSLAFEEPVAQIETLARSSLYAEITTQLDVLDALWEYSLSQSSCISCLPDGRSRL